MVPVMQRRDRSTARVLMVPVRLLGHEQVPVDDLVANRLDGRQPLEILRGEAGGDAHGGASGTQARSCRQYTMPVVRPTLDESGPVVSELPRHTLPRLLRASKRDPRMDGSWHTGATRVHISGRR